MTAAVLILFGLANLFIATMTAMEIADRSSAPLVWMLWITMGLGAVCLFLAGRLSA